MDNYETLLYKFQRYLKLIIFKCKWSSESEAMENLLETYWTSLGVPQLEPNSLGIYHSNQCTESDFFKLETLGPFLEPPQCFSVEQRDFLSSTIYEIIP